MLSTDTQWTFDRIRLYKLRRRHPTWTYQQLADKLQYSVSWVKKWLKRFREAQVQNLQLFSSRSRAPKNPVGKVTPAIRDFILSLRQKLPERYGRVPGDKTILYHLHQDGYFDEDVKLPTSNATIWRVLKDAGYIPERVKTHVPLDLQHPCKNGNLTLARSKLPQMFGLKSHRLLIAAPQF